tara:strand:- start:561 stop:869 length:309 start_codon:yes stop_codon:yes gene_type:complete
MTGFAKGSLVRVKSHFPPCPPAHCRTPFYIRGCVGKIERICGAFENPEELAFGRIGGDKKVLYRVRFSQSDIWGDYEGSKNDQIDIELYDFWLENLEGERKK